MSALRLGFFYVGLIIIGTIDFDFTLCGLRGTLVYYLVIVGQRGVILTGIGLLARTRLVFDLRVLSLWQALSRKVDRQMCLSYGQINSRSPGDQTAIGMRKFPVILTCVEFTENRPVANNQAP